MTSATKLIIKRRRRLREKRRRQARDQIVLIAFTVLFSVLVVAPLALIVGSVWITYADASERLPNPRETLTLAGNDGETEIFDSSGRVLLFSVEDPLGAQRTWITLDELPDVVAQATILWEDPDFLEATHFSIWGMSADLWRNWTSEYPSPADSSITGRLVRGVILKRAPNQAITHDDRATEIALIAEINRRYTPAEILEWHLNTNYYGNEAYGMEAAAQVYLGKSARDLTLDEAALLAAIPTAPEFNPADDETKARDRQSDLLRRLLSSGFITQSEFQAVINVSTPIKSDAGQRPAFAPDFARYARKQAETILNALGYDGAQLVSRGGLRITTTLDMDLYDQTDCTLRVHLARINGENTADITTRNGNPCTAAAYLPATFNTVQVPPDQGAVVVVNPTTGELLTMNGSTTRYAYQPGAVLYPLIYLDGFLNSDPNYTAASMLLDIPQVYPGVTQESIYRPTNPSGIYYGPISLRDAMSVGLVSPVAQVANRLNINTVIHETVSRLGINSLRDSVYPLEILQRGGQVSVLDVAYSYSVLAAMGTAYGLRVEPLAPGLRDSDPLAVRRIQDADGKVLWSYDDAQRAANQVKVLDESVAYILNDVLADSDSRATILGEGTALDLDQRAAVVNAITLDQADNWTVGYTPQLLVTVHLGQANRGSTTLDGFALDGAAQVWNALMRYVDARDNLPNATWEAPDTLIQAPVCVISGLSPNGICETHDEYFLAAGQVPPEDTYWQSVEINTQTNQRASITTPDQVRRAVQYFIPPDEALDWWRANNQPLPPTDYDTISQPDILSTTTLLLPGSYDTVGGVVDIRGSMNDANRVSYQVRYGEGANATEWLTISGEQTTFAPGTSLALWDTTGLDGVYVLELRVLRTNGTVETDFVPVIVDNTPPAILLNAGEPGQPVRIPDQQTLLVQAQVTDNRSVRRVDFYHNGQFIVSDDAYPFEFEFSLTRTGTETFTAVVYDAVGNSSEATLDVTVTR